MWKSPFAHNSCSLRAIFKWKCPQLLSDKPCKYTRKQLCWPDYFTKKATKCHPHLLSNLTSICYQLYSPTLGTDIQNSLSYILRCQGLWLSSGKPFKTSSFCINLYIESGGNDTAFTHDSIDLHKQKMPCV